MSSALQNLTPEERDERVLMILRASGGAHDFTDSPFSTEFREAAKALKGRVSIKGSVLKLKGRAR